jgi:hypothetical protein
MYSLIKHLIFILFLIGTLSVDGQHLNGVITNLEGQPLPFATVYIKNTTYGVAANSYGEYFIELKQGKQQLVFSYVGYSASEKEININGTSQFLNIQLTPSSEELRELEIVSNTKNKAKEIIKSVKKNKKQFSIGSFNFKYNQYTKNSIEKRQIKSIYNDQDSNSKLSSDTSINVNYKNDILKFIESYSTIYFQQPNRYYWDYSGYHDFADTKNEQSYTVSADMGFGEYQIVPEYESEDEREVLNELMDIHINLYDNNIALPNITEKAIVSPLGFNGFIYYKYDLEGSFYNKKNKIYKIKVTPLFKGEPLFEGLLFIEDETFRIASYELKVSGPKLNYEEFHLIEDFSMVKPSFNFSKRKVIDYTIKEGKYKVIGNIKTVLKNHQINNNLPEYFSKNQIKYFNDSIQLRDSIFWSKIRSIELKENELSYIKHTDSLRKEYQSEKHLLKQDSIMNKITLGRLVFAGLFHRNRYKGNTFYLEPFVSQFNFFGIGGYRHRIGWHFDKNFANNNKLELNNEIDYGFRNKDPKGNIELAYNYSKKRFLRTFISIGDRYTLINRYASVSSSFSRGNYVRSKHIKVSQRGELWNGLYGEIKLEHAIKSPLIGLDFANWSMQVFGELNNPEEFTEYTKSEIRLQLTWVPFQKFYYKGDRKISLGSDLPTVNLIYRKGLPGIFNSEVDFDYLEIGANDKFKIPQLGTSQWNIQIGSFLNKKNLRIIEWKYFRGSDPIFFSNPLNSFQLLGPTLSTENEFLRANYLHHFEGNILNKIPLLHYLKLQISAGSGIILVPRDDLAHAEVYFGISRRFKIKNQIFKLNTYAVTSANTLVGANYQFKFGINMYDPFNKRWDY